VGEAQPDQQHTLAARVLAALSYVVFPKHVVQTFLLFFFGTVWNIGFVGSLVGGPAFAIGYLIVLLALGVLVQIGLACLIYMKPDALVEVRRISLFEWHWVKDL
jgi:hypothetical protein